MKLGLFGGTFNPVHSGHIQVAIEVQQKLCFDHIYFIPSKHPPHKSGKELVSTTNRCEMINRSMPIDFPFSLSYVEVSRNGPSYSIDTVKYFRSGLSFQDKLYFILGIDAFLEFHTWKSYKNLIKLAELIIVSRSSLFKGLYTDTNDCGIIQKYISEKLFYGSKSHFCISKTYWTLRGCQPIRYFRIKSPNISSSSVRELIRLGKNFNYLVPSTVAKYIRERELYL